jgi:hypothetical protein
MTDLPDDLRGLFPDLERCLSEAPDLFSQIALDLEAGRINLDGAKAKMRRLGFRVAETIYGESPALQVSVAVPFDPVAAWQSLSPEARDAIGAASIAAAVADVGHSIMMYSDDLAGARPYIAAGLESRRLVAELVIINVLGGEETTLPPRPDLRPLGIRQCRACGCTDRCACDGGCSWVETDLCSACVPAAPR